MAQILAIESDPERIVILRRLVSEKLNADVIVADSIESAIDTLECQRTRCDPDVEPAVTRRRSAARRSLATGSSARSHAGADAAAARRHETMAPSSRGLLSRLFRRRRQSWPTYDADAVAARIKDARSPIETRRARNTQTCGSGRRACFCSNQRSRRRKRPSLVYTLDADLARFLGIQPQQDRAPRWERTDLPWLESIRLTWGADLHLLNMSSSGLLVESGIRMTRRKPDGLSARRPRGARLRDVGRVVRSDVASVSNLGVKYVTAAVFDKPFEAIGPDGSLPPQRAYRRFRRAVARRAADLRLTSARG